MTIREYIKRFGWQSEVSGKLKRYQLVDIDFVDADGNDDETQFLIVGAGTKQGGDELTGLFAQFCCENHIETNTVTSVTIVEADDTCEELLL